MLEWGGLAAEVTSERGRLMRAAPWGEDAGGGDGRELRELQAAPGAVRDAGAGGAAGRGGSACAPVRLGGRVGVCVSGGGFSV